MSFRPGMTTAAGRRHSSRPKTQGGEIEKASGSWLLHAAMPRSSIASWTVPEPIRDKDSLPANFMAWMSAFR